MVRHREGNFAHLLGDPDRGRHAWTDAAAIAQRIGDVAREAQAVHNLALLSTDPLEAVRLFERSIELQPPLGERDIYKAKMNLAGLMRRAGDAAVSDTLAAEVLAWAKRVGDYQYIGAGEREMGERELQRGDAAEALERATRSRDLGASRGHSLMTLLAEHLRCRALLRLGLQEDAIRSLADAFDIMRHGDLEADDELSADGLLVATEVMAASGDVDLAASLDAVRRRTIEGWPRLPDVEQAHDDWFRNNGVVSTDRADADLGTALAKVRDWLSDHRADRSPGIESE
jgi:hypothetical protein